MKKVTLILSFFILACAGKSFAQTKTPVKDIAAAPATGSNAAKPKPKPKPAPKPAPKPSSGAFDQVLKIEKIPGEST